MTLLVQVQLAPPHDELEQLRNVAGGAEGHADVFGNVWDAAQPVRQEREPRERRARRTRVR